MVLMSTLLNNIKELVNQYVYTKEETRENFDDFVENHIGYENGYFYVNEKPPKVIIPPLDGTDEITSWTNGTNNTADGIYTSHGSYLEPGWSNESLWKIEFDYKYTATRYIGTMFLCTSDINPFTDAKRNSYAITTWEGGFPPGGSLTYTESPSSFTKPSQTAWNHVSIEKLDDTTIEMVLNDTYTWTATLSVLPNWNTIHIGSRDNPSSRNTGGNIQYRNIIIYEGAGF